MGIFKKSIALKKLKRFLYEKILVSDLTEEEKRERIFGVYNAVNIEEALSRFLGKRQVEQNIERDVLIDFVEDELGWED